MIRRPHLMASLLFLVFSSSCKESSTNPGAPTTFTGTIENWQGSGNENLYLELGTVDPVTHITSTTNIDTVTISSDGSFPSIFRFRLHRGA